MSVSLRLQHFNFAQTGKYTAHQLDAVRPIVNLNDSQHKTNGDLFEASRPLRRPKKGRWNSIAKKNLYKAVRGSIGQALISLKTIHRI